MGILKSPKLARFERGVRGYLRGPCGNRWGVRADDMRRATFDAYWLTRAFYILAMVVAFDKLRVSYDIALSGAEPAPLWTVFWLNFVPLYPAACLIGAAMPIAAFLALAFPNRRWPRIAVFVSFLQFTSLDNSFGSINHEMYFPLWTSLFLVFVPKGPAPLAEKRLSTLFHWTLMFFIAQAFIALFYTLSGINKSYPGFFPGEGIVSSFAPEALPR
ncbi:MAG: hypothetical protein AAGL49_12795, partial [Pseudomonadota bacterium]